MSIEAADCLAFDLDHALQLVDLSNSDTNLLDNDETAGDRKSRVRVETGVFVRTVCGGCESVEQDRSGAGQRGGITTDTT